MIRVSTCCLGLLLMAAAAPTQDRRGPVMKPSRFAPVAGSEDACNLVVKFAEGSGARWRDDRLVSLAGRDTGPVMEHLRRAKSVERLFSRSESELDADFAELKARLSTLQGRVDPPCELNLYFRVRSASQEEGILMWSALAALDMVETVFPDTPVGYSADPQDLAPPTPFFDGYQGYYGPAPVGQDMAKARLIPGGRGEPLQLCDIETGLILDHEDVDAAVAANVIGLNPTPTSHGLSVAGLLVANRNGYGVSGGVPRARYRFRSHQSAFWADSVNVAAANSLAGDIIVLEVQLPCPVSGSGACPMEGRQDVFDAVRNATLAGIHVVAAAGNGGLDLDNPVFLGAFDRNVRDSGAVLVGATNGSLPVRASFSNYGSIVDANGWGASVATTGGGDLFTGNGDPRQTYTSQFMGTSSATPMVASAAAATLGASAFQLGQTLSPSQLRDLLRNQGFGIATIGRRPDLGMLLAAVGLPNGLWQLAEVDLGGTINLQFTASGSELVVLLAAWDGIATDLPFGRLLLDPVSAFPVGVQAGGGAYSLPVPNDQALAGSELHWQALRYDPTSGSLSLSGSAVTHLAR